MSKIKTFTDSYGDTFEVDTALSSAAVYVNTGKAGDNIRDDVELNPSQVIALRKVLKKWLVKNGHAAPTKREEVFAVVTVEHTPESDFFLATERAVAVTLEDEDGRILETVWEAGRA